MTELKLTLPDRLAREARAAGLLSPKAIKALLREAMRRRAAAREFLAVADRVAAAGVPPMTEDEIQAEIDAVRRTDFSKRSRPRKFPSTRAARSSMNSPRSSPGASSPARSRPARRASKSSLPNTRHSPSS